MINISPAQSPFSFVKSIFMSARELGMKSSFRFFSAHRMLDKSSPFAETVPYSIHRVS